MIGDQQDRPDPLSALLKERLDEWRAATTVRPDTHDAPDDQTGSIEPIRSDGSGLAFPTAEPAKSVAGISTVVKPVPPKQSLRLPILAGLILAALAILAYFPTLRGGSRVRADEERPVEFHLSLPESVNTVHVGGTFNGWQFRRNPMQSEDGGRTWKAKVALAPGSYQYKFVLNGYDWRTDPDAGETVDDGNGNRNSLIWVDPFGKESPAKVGDGRITAAALKHVQRDLRYCDADGSRLWLTLRTRADDVESAAVGLNENGRELLVPMERLFTDPLFSYYRASIPYRACKYAFRLKDASSIIWLSPGGGSKNPPQARYEFAPGDGPHLDTPVWMADAIFYQILPDRFANGDPSNDNKPGAPLDSTGRRDRFFGGDLQGVKDHLNDIKSLGVNALYFNPIFTGASHHKYDTDDYLHVDAHFGGDAAFKQLMRAAKADHIHVMLDGVFNHTGVGFFAFQDLLSNQERSKYKDWYTVHSYPVRVQPRPSYEGWWGIQYLPKLNQMNPEVREFTLKTVEDWTRKAGIDAWRLDAANEVDDELWREMRRRLRKINHNEGFVGEIWGDGSHWLQGDMFDSVMNYRWRTAVLDWIAHGKSSPSQFDAKVRELQAVYPPQALRSMYNPLGSHDTPRIRTECGGDWDRVRLAFLLQMTSPGAPAIYYGDEIGMEGGRDPDNRKPMNFTPGPLGRGLRSYIKELIALRKSIPALRRGDWTTMLTDDRANTYAYARRLGDQFAIVVINNSAKAASVDAPVPFFSGQLNVAAATTPAVQPPSKLFCVKHLHVSLPPLSGIVLTP